MNILQIVDVPYWAIGKLSQSIVAHNPHLNIKTVYVHPKHVAEHVAEVEKWLSWCDIVDFQYWNSARQLMEHIPELKDKPSVLSHHNEKDLLSGDWDSIDLHIAETKYSLDVLEAQYPGKVQYTPLAIDLEKFKFIDKLPGTKTVGYVGRIVPWKGLKETAQACFELGYTLKLMGKFDKPDYWQSLSPEAQANIDTEYMDCEDDERANFYKEIDIYVGNSGPGRETGTLPFMEAMASGVPCLTTPSGIAADIAEDHENAIVTEFGNYDDLKGNLQMLMENTDLQEKIRHKAWNTLKNYSEEQRAWEFERAYHRIYSEDPLVSVIVPVYNSVENLVKILSNLEKSLQFYNHIEVVIADDGSDDGLHGRIKHWREIYSFPIKYIQTDSRYLETYTHYGLAEARNRAAIAAHGEYLMFCDVRMQPDPEALQKMMKKISEFKKEKVWIFGDKGANKDSFVENFSMIRRDNFFKAGMMNERIDSYGGMSQELRTRFGSQGFKFVYLPEAKAQQLSGSHMNDKRRQDIIKSKLLLWKMGM